MDLLEPADESAPYAWNHNSNDNFWKETTLLGDHTMPTREITGATVDVNEEGYFTNPDQWTEAMAPVLAQEEELGELAEGHWKVINFLRQDYKEKGTMPTIRRVKNA